MEIKRTTYASKGLQHVVFQISFSKGSVQGQHQYFFVSSRYKETLLLYNSSCILQSVKVPLCCVEQHRATLKQPGGACGEFLLYKKTDSGFSMPLPHQEKEGIFQLWGIGTVRRKEASWENKALMHLIVQLLLCIFSLCWGQMAELRKPHHSTSEWSWDTGESRTEELDYWETNVSRGQHRTTQCNGHGSLAGLGMDWEG